MKKKMTARQANEIIKLSDERINDILMRDIPEDPKIDSWMDKFGDIDVYRSTKTTLVEFDYIKSTTQVYYLFNFYK